MAEEKCSGVTLQIVFSNLVVLVEQRYGTFMAILPDHRKTKGARHTPILQIPKLRLKYHLNRVNLEIPEMPPCCPVETGPTPHNPHCPSCDDKHSFHWAAPFRRHSKYAELRSKILRCKSKRVAARLPLSGGRLGTNRLVQPKFEGTELFQYAMHQDNENQSQALAHTIFYECTFDEPPTLRVTDQKESLLLELSLRPPSGSSIQLFIDNRPHHRPEMHIEVGHHIHLFKKIFSDCAEHKISRHCPCDWGHLGNNEPYIIVPPYVVSPYNEKMISSEAQDPDFRPPEAPENCFPPRFP